MATQDEVTNCPSCKSLCLGPTILPCGHVVCRKCLFRILNANSEQKPACRSCDHSIALTKGQTISQLANQLDTDFVLEDLVTQQLARRQFFCKICPNKVAIHVCLDCGEYHCDTCSNPHKKGAATKHHLQQDLPRTLLNESQTSQPGNDVITCTPGDSSRYNLATKTLPKNKEATGEEKNKLGEEVRQCKKGAYLLEFAISALEANIVQLQEVKNRLKNKQRLLLSYVDTPDDVMMANAPAMLPRVRRVREDCHPPTEAALNKLAEHINTLTDKPGGSRGPTTLDPMTSVPQRKFTVKPDVLGDTHTHGPFIPSIVFTGDGRLVMADRNNSTIKVAELTDPARTVRGAKVDTMPHSLALLPGNQVAVTAKEKVIYFVKISGRPSLVSHVKTARQYWGVAFVTEDDTLVVGCRKEDGVTARVDIITRAGDVVRSVIDSRKISDLKSPDNLCWLRGRILVSDSGTNVVHRVELATGRVVDKLAHPELKAPCQVTSDSNGNIYIASVGGQCVLVVSPAGQWRRLLYGPDDGDGLRKKPCGVCVTSTDIVVTWDEVTSYSVVVAYGLT